MIIILEKIWCLIEKNKFYRKVCENRFFGKLFNRETINYIFFGVLTTIVSIVAYAGVLWVFDKKAWLAGDSATLTELMTKHPWLAHVPNLSTSVRIFVVNIISWLITVVFAFVVNKLFVFESRSWEKSVAVKELTGFVGARLFSLAAETAVIIFWVSVLGGNEIFAKAVIAQIIVMILNYVLSKLFIFKKTAM
jgi:putative flippase GtrA